MPSLKCRLFIFALKYRHLLRFQLKRTKKIDSHTSIQKLREDVEKGADFFGKLPADFRLEPIKIKNLNAEWMLPANAGKDRVILYFHGGGLVLGSIKAHRSIVAKFVKGTGIGALLFDYSLAPEHPFPEGLNDSVSAYQYLLGEGAKPEHIVFMDQVGEFNRPHHIRNDCIRFQGELMGSLDCLQTVRAGGSSKHLDVDISFEGCKLFFGFWLEDRLSLRYGDDVRDQ